VEHFETKTRLHVDFSFSGHNVFLRRHIVSMSSVFFAQEIFFYEFWDKKSEKA